MRTTFVFLALQVCLAITPVASAQMGEPDQVDRLTESVRSSIL